MTKRLLIVDDALIIREMIREAATEAGWEVVGQAANGQEAISQYQDLRPDAVTLDLIMPEFDGIHALRGIIDLDPAARILVVSAIDQTEILKDALRIGATDFVVKPFETKRLVTALEKLATQRRAAATT